MTEMTDSKNFIVKFDSGHVEVRDGVVSKIQDDEQNVLFFEKEGAPEATLKTTISANKRKELFLHIDRSNAMSMDSNLVYCDLDHGIKKELSEYQAKEAMLYHVTTFFDRHSDVKNAVKEARLPESLGGIIVKEIPTGASVKKPLDYCRDVRLETIDIRTP